MNTQPLVSVFIPCYNHEKYIQDAIVSIVKQTYKNIELIVIDDGSSDNSPKIINALSKEYHFYFEIQKNMGLIPTMNKLFSLCKGKYITGCASDDMFMLDKIEKQVTFMEGNPDIGMCYGNVLLINDNNEILTAPKQHFSKQEIIDFADIILFRCHIPTPTVMYRASIFNQLGYYDSNFYPEDIYMWLKMTFAGVKIKRLNDLFGFYRFHESNIHYNVFKMYEGTMKVLFQYKDHPLFKSSIKKRRLHYFPFLAIYNKKEALKIIISITNFNINFILGCILLIVPSIISKNIIKFVTKHIYKEYSYLSQ